MATSNYSLLPKENDRLLCVKVGKVKRENLYEMARKYWGDRGTSSLVTFGLKRRFTTDFTTIRNNHHRFHHRRGYRYSWGRKEFVLLPMKSARTGCTSAIQASLIAFGLHCPCIVNERKRGFDKRSLSYARNIGNASTSMKASFHFVFGSSDLWHIETNWWMMDDGWWMMDDGWWLMDEAWWNS